MKHIPASKFKQQIPSLLDRLSPEGVVITRRGRPVAKLVPIPNESSRLIGALSGKLTIHGDLLSTGVRWDAES